VQKDNLLLSVNVHISVTKISLFPSLYCIIIGIEKVSLLLNTWRLNHGEIDL